MNPKKEFIEIYTENIKREGSDKLLEYLLSSESDFFTAPASTKYHGAYKCGLVMHSINVFWNLCDYLSRSRCLTEYKMKFSLETIAIAGLLHDICKNKCYKRYLKNVKGEDGVWRQEAAFTHDDQEPYGHGEKSVYIISKFMKLTDEEAYAIRFHMGFSNQNDTYNLSKVFGKYPLALALYVADMEASYYMDDKMELEIETEL